MEFFLWGGTIHPYDLLCLNGGIGTVANLIHYFFRLGLQERKLVKELVEQEGKPNILLLRVLLTTWQVSFLIMSVLLLSMSGYDQVTPVC